MFFLQLHCVHVVRIHSGIPQGSVLAPILYLQYTTDIPETAHTTIVTFANQIDILSFCNNLTVASDNYNYISTLSVMDKTMEISPNHNKSAWVAFTIRTTDFHPGRTYFMTGNDTSNLNEGNQSSKSRNPIGSLGENLNSLWQTRSYLIK